VSVRTTFGPINIFSIPRTPLLSYRQQYARRLTREKLFDELLSTSVDDESLELEYATGLRARGLFPWPGLGGPHNLPHELRPSNFGDHPRTPPPALGSLKPV